jgi:hypothetical protein
MKSITESQEGGFDPELFWRTIIRDRIIDVEGSPNEYVTYFQAFQAYVSSEKDINGEATILREAFHNTFSRVCMCRKFCVTQNRRTALTPPYTQPGDIVCNLAGSAVPFAIRLLNTAVDGRQTYAVLGECYMHGLMYGGGLHLGEMEEIIIR